MTTLRLVAEAAAIILVVLLMIATGVSFSKWLRAEAEEQQQVRCGCTCLGEVTIEREE